MSGHVAVFVDGENVRADYAEAIDRIAAALGAVDVQRVYGNAATQPKWDGMPGFRFVHSGTGKNATDILLTVEAMEAALVGDFDTLVIASSDRDFTHLVTRMRELGRTVIGIGEAKATPQFRAACTRFELLAPQDAVAAVKVAPSRPAPAAPAAVSRMEAVSGLDLCIRDFIKANSTNGQGVRIQLLGPMMHSRHGVRISTFPEKTWRAYFQKRPGLFDLDPRGQDAKVRFRPAGFAAKH